MRGRLVPCETRAHAGASLFRLYVFVNIIQRRASTADVGFRSPDFQCGVVAERNNVELQNISCIFIYTRFCILCCSYVNIFLDASSAVNVIGV